MTLRGTLHAALSAAVTGRPIVLLGRLPRDADRPLPSLRRLGAGPFLRVTLRQGPHGGGPVIEHIVLRPGPAPPDFVLDGAELERELAEPGDLLGRAVRRFDPDGRAWIVGPGHLRCPALLGRPRFGARRTIDLALEDKTAIDSVWAELALPHLPTRVVPTLPHALDAAARELDQGDGTVWAGDNSSGWEGGALATRWVHDGPSRARALDVLTPRCRTTRVMPFQSGLPVSIHAWCLARGVAVLSPMEMVVLRHPGTGAFRFCGCATTWTPGQDTTHRMRRFAHRVASHLRQHHGYRGALSIDGVLTRNGFFPTELNARFPAGLSRLARGMDDLPLGLADGLIRDGGLEGLSPALMQAVLRAQLAHAPLAWLHSPAPRAPSMAHAIGLQWTDRGFRRATPGEPAATTLSWGPGQSGGALRLRILAPPRGWTGGQLLTSALRAAGPPLSRLLDKWQAAQPPE